ncbi:DUF3108 domain-containing protein [Robbsia andropogonis]|uniref:DUF3108 domain-containing protein n=1 Tax=Robbsia andropogonis TaxID=28092 RepID=UPI000464C236|nr:DUF3108 domain-containing protein [Robbsia andropogonis]
MRDNAAMRDARPPSSSPARQTVSSAVGNYHALAAWPALQRGVHRRRARMIVAIVAAVFVHLSVMVAFLAGLLGQTHGVEPAAKAHAIVELLQPTRIARDGRSDPLGTPDETRDAAAGNARKSYAAGTFQPLLTPPPPVRTPPMPPPRRPAPLSSDAQAPRRGKHHLDVASPAKPASAVAGASDIRRPRSADDIEATAARLALAAGVSAASVDEAPVGNTHERVTNVDSGAPVPASTTSTTGTAAPDPGTGTPGPAQQGTRFALMPSCDLVYDTFYNGAQNQSGTLHWRTDGHHYTLLVSMPVPFIGTYSYRSEGHIDDYGLAPDTYTETRGRRGTSVSRFVRDDGSPHVAFTRTPNNVPLPAGAQDRFSMIFQLASLVRADASLYQPGVTRAFDVIDSDSAEIWPIQTIGTDQTMIGNRPVATLHFMRLPRKEGDKRRIDVWLAPSMNWVPVRIMQTEPNGTQIELLFHARLPPAGASDDSATDNNAVSDGAYTADPSTSRVIDRP